MTHTEALQLALDALDHLLQVNDPRMNQSHCECDPSVGYQCPACRKPAPEVVQAEAAIEALRAALAAPAHAPDARWYCVTRDGAATLCVDQDDAQTVAAEQDDLHPRNGPHRAVQLIEATPQPAPAVVPAGMALAPMEPTLDMGWAYLDAAREADPYRDHSFNHAGYRAMLPAAPQQTPTPQTPGVHQ